MAFFTVFAFSTLITKLSTQQQTAIESSALNIYPFESEFFSSQMDFFFSTRHLIYTVKPFMPGVLGIPRSFIIYQL